MSETQTTEPLILVNSYYSIGRSSLCDIVILDQHISRFHCTLILFVSEENDIYYLLRDGNLSNDKSANGVYINGQKVTKNKRLRHQDEITFGINMLYPKVIFISSLQEELLEHSTIPAEYE